VRAHRILALALRILAQFMHDKRTLGLMLVVPLLVMALIGYVFRSQENKTVAVAVVNEDVPSDGKAPLSKVIVDALGETGKASLAGLSRTEAEAAVRSGQSDVALVFNPSFTDELWKNRRTSLGIIVEGSNPAQSGAALGAVSALVMQKVPDLLKNMVPRPLAFLFAKGLPLEISVQRLHGSASFTVLDFFAPLAMAFLSFFLVFLLTSVSFLRERTHGTMERLAASPASRLEIVLGYMAGFGLFSLLQMAILVSFTLYVLKVQIIGSPLAVLLVAGLLVLGAVNLGILLSAFARNELQAIQFIPIVIIPQFVLSGLLWPLADMPRWLRVVARLMPLTWANEALVDIMVRGRGLPEAWLGLVVLAGFAVVAGGLAAWSIRREVA
jgi:ABC-2 type transport system permease protein